MKKLLQIIKKLILLWVLETSIAAVLYIPTIIFFHESGVNEMRYIIFLNMFRLIYFYWVLIIVYFKFDLSQTKEMIITNLCVFTIMSLIFSLAIKDAYNLFFQYSFICNIVAIILAPIILKKVIINLLGNKL